MKVLICEDNQLAIKTISYVLEMEGIKSESAEDGNKALACMQKNIYDLIVVDIHLPYHSGLELIDHLRSDLKMETPVLVLSAFSDLKMQKQARELGISGYILKPFSPSDLVTRIRFILNNN